MFDNWVDAEQFRVLQYYGAIEEVHKNLWRAAVKEWGLPRLATNMKGKSQSQGEDIDRPTRVVS